MAGGTILLVEDDIDIAEMVRLHLERAGFRVEHDATGAAASQLVRRSNPVAVLLDLGLPSSDGIDICREIRGISQIPIVMVTARGTESDVIIGLEVGADDYIAKPFSPRELVARIEAVLRRSHGTYADPGDRLVIDGHVLDLGQRLVASPDGSSIRPTTREFDLLWYLAENANIVVSRSQILGEVWGYGYDGESRTIDVHIRQLRMKFPELTIETVRGVGYRIVAV